MKYVVVVMEYYNGAIAPKKAYGPYDYDKAVEVMDANNVAHQDDPLGFIIVPIDIF